MKVLMLNYEYPPIGGGAANANRYVLRELSKKGVEVDLVTSSTACYSEERPFDNVRIFRVDVDKDELHQWKQIELVKYTLRGLYKSLSLKKKNDYDIIHAWSGVPCGFMAKLLRQKYIVALRGSDVPGYSSRFSLQYRFLKPLIKSVWSSSEQAIPNSKGLKQLAKETADLSMRVVPNGVDIDQFSPGTAQEGGLKVLTVARLVERKRVQDAIKALEGLEAELIVVGEGPERDRLETLAENIDVREKAEFKGYVDHSDIDEIYASADVFLLPSMNEGMSNTVLEAMASGLPIIVTDTGGTEELIDGNGFLIDKKSPKDITDAIESYIENQDIMERHSRASRSIAEEMSWGKVADRYLDIYKNI